MQMDVDNINPVNNAWDDRASHLGTIKRHRLDDHGT